MKLINHLTNFNAKYLKFIGRCFLFVCFSAQAESTLTCPSIESVHAYRGFWPHGDWIPLYIDTGEMAYPKDIEKFIGPTTRSFSRAEWQFNDDRQAHCFYLGSDRVILVRELRSPNPEIFPRWTTIDKKIFICHSKNEDDCPFGGFINKP